MEYWGRRRWVEVGKMGVDGKDWVGKGDRGDGERKGWGGLGVLGVRSG